MDLREAERLAREKMREWGVGPEWQFKWSNGKRQLGCATQTRNRITGATRNHQLRLSRYLVMLNGRDEVLDTILHEIAHIKAGLHNGHNNVWKEWARRVGARPVRCADSKRVKMPEAKYVICCGCCHKVLAKRHRRMRADKLSRLWHPPCGKDSVGQAYYARNSAVLTS